MDRVTLKTAPAVEIVPEYRYKRVLDLLILAGAHVLLAPMWLLVWTAIPFAIYVEDRGPVFYRQVRLGKGGRQFVVRKFRSMVPDAEKVTGPTWSRPADERVTRVGRILRRTAIDELPQLLNILAGDMSFVGPRSERPELYTRIVHDVPEFGERLKVRPGLTGPAQLYGNYDDSPSTKLARDLEYIARQSLWLDLKLIALSVFRSFGARWDNHKAA